MARTGLQIIAVAVFVYVADVFSWAGVLACLPIAFAAGWLFSKWEHARVSKKRN